MYRQLLALGVAGKAGWRTLIVKVARSKEGAVDLLF